MAVVSDDLDSSLSTLFSAHAKSAFRIGFSSPNGKRPDAVFRGVVGNVTVPVFEVTGQPVTVRWGYGSMGPISISSIFPFSISKIRPMPGKPFAL